MLMRYQVEKFVASWLNPMFAALTTALGSNVDIPATCNATLQYVDEEITMQTMERVNRLRDAVIDHTIILTWREADMLEQLSFTYKLLYFVDRHSRDFAAYWLMQQYPEIYLNYPAALEVVHDVMASVYNETPRNYPDPRLLDMCD